MASGALVAGSLFAASPANALENDLDLRNTNSQIEVSSTLENQFYPGGREQTPQIKIKAGKFVVGKIRDALRSGNVDEAIRHIPGLDQKAKNSLRQNASGVADALDEILYYADLPERAIREKLFNMLSSAGMDYGSAQLVAETVANIISWTVL
ncbi:hypothetical protein ACN08Y_10765 [Rothia sp. P5764]|uniref:hypothetical protein n=1 Tax=Rothia sp. P5764 TaxID=3402654 RepID=UPI003AC64DE2